MLRRCWAGAGTSDDWDTVMSGTGAEVFADVSGSMSRGHRRLYGYAHHSV